MYLVDNKIYYFQWIKKGYSWTHAAAEQNCQELLPDFRHCPESKNN